MGFSNYLEEKVLNENFTSKTVYVALFKTNPTDNNTGEEVSGGSYTRQVVTFGTPRQVAGKGTVSNTGDVVFPLATAEWGTIAHVAIFDAPTAGNLLSFKENTNPRAVQVSDRLRFLTGELSIDLD
ncbi:hypothetical protein QE450_000851 [Paenibacillus sp. SORGH_AS306]|uniref:phage tail fiber protein n=1 Tax=unclassified Paenibacillus TaxID=185978 RepID=UPI002783139D|nr:MULTISPECIES: hypothetical protein [unclassified Paenibacillus]MDQ1233353.1 hypothetical protein [Paenibacillus sp. SORGH_AS_0306]MDR6110394.1 hypothetical protein [Paenibacillus sp. SORGH_AS_0338]